MDLKNIAQKLRKAPENIILIYAFNATGKTSLSIQYNEISKDEKEIKQECVIMQLVKIFLDGIMII